MLSLSRKRLFKGKSLPESVARSESPLRSAKERICEAGRAIWHHSGCDIEFVCRGRRRNCTVMAQALKRSYS